MTEERRRIEQYWEADVVRFCEPSPGMLRHFGLRVYVWDEETDMPNKDITPPEDGTLGIILESEYRSTYGGGTLYYQVLMGERVLWIASEHLKPVENPDSA